MLTAEIKSKIDSARNILVGKIPTPTGQVEQITLALVYKFMNDIDEQNKELGGELKFFTGEYSKYAWEHLLDKSLSAYERVTAYGEGLEKMHLNPNLPQFFRNVFKGAFLPFRDPEVLTIFLKQIDEFRYGANGDLGDAFEYLLQVMGTQGDAGQFLTPRHIINFIVSIVDPQKTDKILDPAEGTAGFLISSFLHILKNNTKPDSNLPGSALTYDERKKLSENLVGYDISHDMVRLSLVNLYLHGFADPKIYEYDTLGNLDRWDDDFDCIETNPPFMTPKGGVKPHKRFSIQAKKSEVLFVDYIMEHLNPNGKAGIIVPEGIIFQSATAYKALRKMMVEQNFLYAVVSLPAGIFQPYSGVKTSILLMDRVLAKKTKDILFVKVENDGFDLGAQRRPIDKNDLPRAAEILKRYKMSIQTGKPFELSDEDKKIANLVPIEKISKSGDYNLSGDRYKENNTIVNTQWPMMELGEICDFIGKGGRPASFTSENGKIPFIVSSLLKKKCDQADYDMEALVIGDGGSANIHYIDGRFSASDHTYILKNKNTEKISLKYIYQLIFNNLYIIEKGFQGQGLKNVSKKHLQSIQIPLPPLEVQQEIVAQLDSYQKIIDGACLVIDNWEPIIEIKPEWPMVNLGEICEFKNGLNFTKSSHGETVKVLGVSHFQDNLVAPLFNLPEITIDGKLDETYLLREDDILFVRSNGNQELVGRSIILPQIKDKVSFSGFTIRCRMAGNVKPMFYAYLFKSNLHRELLKNTGRGANIRNLSQEILKEIKIPLPPLNIQKQIVARIEEEQQMVDANKKLIEIYQGKIKEKIDEIWGA